MLCLHHAPQSVRELVVSFEEPEQWQDVACLLVRVSAAAGAAATACASCYCLPFLLLLLLPPLVLPLLLCFVATCLPF